jgi:hypothetical protein
MFVGLLQSAPAPGELWEKPQMLQILHTRAMQQNQRRMKTRIPLQMRIEMQIRGQIHTCQSEQLATVTVNKQPKERRLWE